MPWFSNGYTLWRGWNADRTNIASYVVLDKTGTIVYDITKDYGYNATPESSVRYGTIVVRAGGKYGLITCRGDVIYPFEYGSTKWLSSGIRVLNKVQVLLFKGEYCRARDLNGNIILDLEYPNPDYVYNDLGFTNDSSIYADWFDYCDYAGYGFFVVNRCDYDSDTQYYGLADSDATAILPAEYVYVRTLPYNPGIFMAVDRSSIHYFNYKGEEVAPSFDYSDEWGAYFPGEIVYNGRHWYLPYILSKEERQLFSERM